MLRIATLLAAAAVAAATGVPSFSPQWCVLTVGSVHGGPPSRAARLLAKQPCSAW